MKQIKRTKTQLLSFLLALMTVLSLLPTPALAAITTGTGIAATTDANRWSTRLNAHGQPYTYKPPVINGKYLYCVDRGYSWRWGNPSFTGSYTYKYATGADADAVVADAIAGSGLGEASAEALENIKWMASYVNDYIGEIPGALFMAVQTYIWDNQSDKTAGGDTSGDIDAGGYANVDTYDIYLGYIDFILGEKAQEDSQLQQQVEEYRAQGISARIVEDESQKWAMLASSNVAGRQHFFTYHTGWKVVTSSEPIPDPPDEPDPPTEGSGTITLKKVIEGTTRGLDGAVFNIYCDGQIVGSDVTSDGGIITVEDAKTGLWSFVEVSAPEGYAADHTPHSVYVDVSEGDKEYTVSASNAALPGLRIIKTDAQSGSPVPNTVFSVKSVIGSFSTTVTTGGDGTGTLLDLEPGVYVVREESVPEPYILNQTEQTVALQPGKTSEAAFTNYKKPGLEILKKSMASGNPISGVTFLVEQIDGGYSKSVTTDHSGRIFLENIPAGSYKITETAVPEDVILSELPQTVDLEPGSTATVTFRNARKSSITIRKTDAQTGDPVPGVIYTLNKADGATITTEPTGPDGTVTISLLEPGVYTITEQNVPEPYILVAAPQQVTLSPDLDASVEFQNYKKPELTLSKIDADSSDPIPKTVFTVKGIDNDYQDEWTTGIDGKVSLRVPAGTYQVTEKSVPAPYYLPDKDADRVQTISLNPGDEKTLVFRNRKAPQLTIFKECSITSEPIEHAKFHITYTSNGEAAEAPATIDYGELFTDSRSEIRLHEQGKRLYPGEFTITEVEPADGFQLKEPLTQTVIIHGSESKTVRFQNTPLSALVVWKYDSVTGAPVEGAVFQVKYMSGTSGSGGTVIGTYTTGPGGSFTINRLKAGAYTVEELASDGNHVMDTAPQTAYISGEEQDVVQLYFGNSPKGSLLIKKIDAATHEPLSDVEFFITDSHGTMFGDANGKFVTDSMGTILISNIDPGTTVVIRETKAKPNYLLDDVPQTATIKAGQTVTLEFRNQPVGSILVKKMSSTTKEPLSDVVIRITRTDGSVVGTSNGEFRTDESGFVTVDVEPGSYIIQEIKAKSGFLLDNTPKIVEVKGSGVYAVELFNQPLGSLVIHKYSSLDRKTPLAGVQFKVTYAPGCVVDDENGKVSSNGIYYTGSDGTVTINGIVGTVTITEQATIPGYSIDPETRSQTIVVNPDDVQHAYFYNTPKNTLIIEKYLETESGNQPLKGVTFQVTDFSGAVLGSSGGEFISGDDGRVVIAGVEPGTTVNVREIKVPDGVVLDSVPKSIKISNDGTANILRFVNKKTGYLVIRKLDKISREPLANVEFQLTYADGSYVDDACFVP